MSKERGHPPPANAWGAFTETIWPGDNGYQCRTVGDYVHALENVLEGKLSPRKKIAVHARARYSLEACRVKYERVFRSLKQAHEGKGAISVIRRRFGKPLDPSGSIYAQLYWGIEIAHEGLMKAMRAIGWRVGMKNWNPVYDPATFFTLTVFALTS